MDGTLYKISADKKFASIGKTAEEAEWYVIEEHVEKFVHSIPAGTEVGIKSEKKDNKNHLVFITEKSKSKFNKNKSAPTAAPTNTEPASSPVLSEPSEPAGPVPAKLVPKEPSVLKSPPTPGDPIISMSDSLKRIEIGNMTSRSLVSLQGQLDPTTIKATITDLYNHYKTLVG